MSSILQDLQNQIIKIQKLAKKEILYSTDPLTGEVSCCYVLGINATDGSLFYKDLDGNWAEVITGSGGSGGSPLIRVDFSVNADPNTGGTTFSPNTPQQTDALYVSTIDNSLWIWNGSAYVTYVSPFWTITGNNASASHFIGTTNNQDLRFRTNNTLKALLDTSGNFGINTTPTEKLDVGGNIRFSGALMPNNLPGSVDQILTSQAGSSPLWKTLNFASLGSSPNATGASVSGVSITLQPANASFGGVVSTTAQTFEGTKTFNQDILVRGLRFGTGNDNDITNTVGGYQALNSTFAGSIAETAFGYNALKLDQTGTTNSAFGATALAALINGYNNAAFGSEAGAAITSGASNSLFGYGAGSSILLGNNNIGIGNGALYLTTNGSRNIHIYTKALPGGFPAATGITTGNANVIIGGNVSLGNVSNNIILSDGDGNIRFKDDNTNTILPRLAGTGTRVVTAGTNGELSTNTLDFGPIGTTPNANGGIVSGTTLTLQPASSTFGGIVSDTTQSFSGNKTFFGNIGINTAAVSGDDFFKYSDSSNTFRRNHFINTNSGTSASIGAFYENNNTDYYYNFLTSTTNSNIANAVVFSTSGTGGLKFQHGGSGSKVRWANANSSGTETDVYMSWDASSLKHIGIPHTASISSKELLCINTSTGVVERIAVADIGAGGGSSINFADEETPSGTMNSSNVTFTLANTPVTGSLKLYLRGLRLKNGTDYTLSGTTITMTTAPDSGDIMVADYRY